MDYINPRIDLAFKKIFGVEENKDLLISLINSVISPADRIIDLELLNPYNPKNFKKDKLSILDIKAKDVDGKRFNIEIQITDEANYDKRALYYWGKLYTEQLQESGHYSCLNKAISVLGVVNLSKEEREIYDDRLKFFMIQSDALQKVKAEGIELGKAEGATIARTSIAKNLLHSGMTVEQVAIITNLNLAQLKNIETVDN